MEEHQAVRKTHVRVMTMPATPEKVFDLLCPTREYDWIEHWNCELIHSNSGFAEHGCVFATDFPGQGGREIWVATRYEPPRAIAFCITGQNRAGQLSIHLSADDQGQTIMVWSREFTAVTAQGADLVRAWAKTIDPLSDLIENMLRHYLETGTMLRGVQLSEALR